MHAKPGVPHDPLFTSCRPLATGACDRPCTSIKWQDRVTHKELWRRADQELMEVQIRGRKWGWLRHTLRKPPSRIVRHYLRWNQQGKRKRRRPRTTRRRSTEAEAQSRGYTWGRLETTTRDREKWRDLVGHLCSIPSERD